MELTAGERLRERFGMTGAASVLARHWLARTLAELGVFSEALVVAREGLEIALSADNVASLPPAHSAIGYVHLCRGDLAEALAPITRAIDIGDAVELLNWGSVSLGLLGLRDVRVGRSAEGVASLERLASLARERGELFNVVLLESWLGEAHLASGDQEGAKRYAQASLQAARAQQQRGTEAWAWRLLGEIAAETDPPGIREAETAYREALTRASSLGMRPLVAHCHLGLGKLYRRTGDRAKAHEHLMAASAMYREMNMGFWLEKAESACAGGDS
jgi:tetratricopeptide (TPR) repeat protein